MNYSQLDSRALLAISGEDAIPFLQGLITSDARRLESGEAIYGALLTPQGKFLHDFFLSPSNGAIFVDCEKLRADDLKKRLSLYKLRSKVTIDYVPENMRVFALWGDEAHPRLRNAQVFADTRMPSLGFRIIGDAAVVSEWASEHGCEKCDESDYHAMRIALGIPQGGIDLIPEKSFLLEWGIDQIGGVDYKKGCYVGQEVTARTHYRGHVKKAPYVIKSRELPLPVTGTPVLCGEAEAGEIRSVSGTTGLAILRVEEVEKSKSSGMPLRAEDVVIEASLPAWHKYPEPSAS